MQRIVLDNFDELENACVELDPRSQRERRRGQHYVSFSQNLRATTLPEPVGDDVKLELIDLGGIHDTADQDLADDEDTAEII